MSDLWAGFTRRLEGRVPAITEDELRACIVAAASEWPDVEVLATDVAEALGRLLASTGEESLPAAPVVSQLYLALACSQGQAAAIDAFEARYFGGLGAALAGIVDDASELDDIKQRLRMRLFVAPEGESARVVDAIGHGDLGSFVRVAALRLALNEKRGDRRRRARAEGMVEEAVDTPELALLRHTHRERFKEAFEHAIARLSARDRNLLRYHLAEHLNIDELAAMYGVHRSTTARWLAAARNQVAEYTQERLVDLIEDEAARAGLFALIRSRLDLSITRIFADEGP